MRQQTADSGQQTLRKVLLLSAVCCLLSLSCATTNSPMLDLKITNGRIIDGTGAPWFRADIGVRGDTIVAIGDLANSPAKTTIDAQNHIVSPGFIDLLGQDENAVFRDAHLEPKIRQGVTSELTGEGGSPRPSLRDFFEKLRNNGTSVNFALLVGASNPREMVIGNVNRKPTAEEMIEMEKIVDQEMRNGAVGLSTSLIYLPAMFSTTDEIINLAKVAAKYGGVYFTHMRDEGDHIDAGLDEAFAIGREAKIPVNIWHLKTGGRTNWGRMPHVIERINAARDEGIDVAANVYPYAASATSLSTVLPDWSLEGGYAEMQKRLADPAQRARIAEALRNQIDKRGEHGIYVTRIDTPALAQFEKKYVEQIANDMNLPSDEALMKLFAETTGSPSVIFFSMNEDDVQYALKQPFVSIGSDSGAPSPEQRAKGAAVHPRAYGTAERVIGHYVRDVKLFTLEEAVRRMTSQAADRIRVSDRGILRPGMKADIIVFDETNVRDLATYEQPNQFSQGMIDVIVNGEPVLRDGVMTSALPGRPIRGRGYVQ
jgi:dihydroorotase/N-acyl-D-amino-acid deacylase